MMRDCLHPLKKLWGSWFPLTFELSLLEPFGELAPSSRIIETKLKIKKKKNLLEVMEIKRKKNIVEIWKLLTKRKKKLEWPLETHNSKLIFCLNRMSKFHQKIRKEIWKPWNDSLKKRMHKIIPDFTAKPTCSG
jgi:hypothetical protein